MRSLHGTSRFADLPAGQSAPTNQQRGSGQCIVAKPIRQIASASLEIGRKTLLRPGADGAAKQTGEQLRSDQTCFKPPDEWRLPLVVGVPRPPDEAARRAARKRAGMGIGLSTISTSARPRSPEADDRRGAS